MRTDMALRMMMPDALPKGGAFFYNSVGLTGESWASGRT